MGYFALVYFSLVWANIFRPLVLTANGLNESKCSKRWEDFVQCDGRDAFQGMQRIDQSGSTESEVLTIVIRGAVEGVGR